MNTRRSLLRELFLAGDSGQVERFHELLHDDVVVHAPFGLSTVGLGAEKASWQQAVAAMPDLRHDLQAVLIDDDMESARCVATGTLRGTYGGISGGGKHFTVDQAVFARLRDGKIAELWEIVDTDALLEQMREPAS
ncbi:MAG TPA: ester cyclase [Gemmatimonadaceae bacterium]